MQSDLTQKFGGDLDDLNEKQRRETMRQLEQYGKANIGDLGGMSDLERTKWLFWNMHENLDELRTLEPALIGQIIRTQMTVSDGQSIWTEHGGLDFRAVDTDVLEHAVIQRPQFANGVPPDQIPARDLTFPAEFCSGL